MWEIQREDRADLLDAPLSAGESSEEEVWEQDWRSDWESEGDEPSMGAATDAHTGHTRSNACRKVVLASRGRAVCKPRQGGRRACKHRDREGARQAVMQHVPARVACAVFCMCKACSARPMLFWVPDDPSGSQSSLGAELAF